MATADPQLTLELNRFNLEYNLTPRLFQGAPFSTLGEEISSKLAQLSSCCAERRCRSIPIGILPTVCADDFGPDAMTDEPRYHALTQVLRRMRGEQFNICIDGEEPIKLSANNLTLEGAATSFQVHLRIPYQHFIGGYNAAQLITPLLVSLSANSPLLLGHKLWHETRIPLFQQSIDARKGGEKWLQPSRVGFGQGWLRHDPIELFEESVKLFPPILACAQTGEAYDALRLHLGTIWRWNRPVFDPIDGGHLRIELRAMPAGPSIIDMCCNAAFATGTIVGLQHTIDALLPALPFEICRDNFYRAAQHGMNAKLVWPTADQQQLKEYPVTAIIESLLTQMQLGLAQLGVADTEVDTAVDNLVQRCAQRASGAQWQLDTLAAYEQTSTRDEALQQMLQRYIAHFDRGASVAEWSVP